MVGRARSCILDIGGDLHHARIKAIAQCFGALGQVIYGALIGDGSQPVLLFLVYLLGAAVMMAGGLVAWFLAVASRSAWPRVPRVVQTFSSALAPADVAEALGIARQLERLAQAWKITERQRLMRNYLCSVSDDNRRPFRSS